MRILVVLCLCATARAEAPTAYALCEARVVTVSGPVLEHATVLVREGLIEAVGENIGVPPDAWVIDAKGLTVYPGLIDALSTWGIPEAAPAATSATGRLGTPPAPATPAPAIPSPATVPAPPARGPEDRPSNTSWVRAADLISVGDRRIESARSAGFTTAVTFPTRGIFAGQGAVVDLAGARSGQMIVVPSVGQYLTLATTPGFSSYPGSLMGVLAYIRQIYLDAGHYRLAREMYDRNPRGSKRPGYDRALEGVLDSPRALLPVSRATDIDRMARFAAELKVKTVFYGGHDAYRAIDRLKSSGIPLLVSLKWPERARDANPDDLESLRTLELRENAPATPAALAKAGVRFAFYSDGIANPRDVVKAVRKAIDAGLTQQDAVRACTLSAAEIYGVADRLGSIEKGKIANLVLTDGDLFQEKTNVKYIFVDGMKYEPVPEEPVRPGGPPPAASPSAQGVSQ